MSRRSDRSVALAVGIDLDEGVSVPPAWNYYGADQLVFASSVSRAIVSVRATASSPPRAEVRSIGEASAATGWHASTPSANRRQFSSVQMLAALCRHASLTSRCGLTCISIQSARLSFIVMFGARYHRPTPYSPSGSTSRAAAQCSGTPAAADSRTSPSRLCCVPASRCSPG